MPPKERYFVGQGSLYVGLRSPSGQPLGLEWLGNVKELAIAIEETTIEHKESYSGQGLIDKVVGTGRSGRANFTADWFTKENLKKFLFGSSTAIAGATVSAETVVGYLDRWTPLSRINLTSLTSLTNTGATTTYVAGTDYDVDLKAGQIFIKSTGAITEGQSLKANYIAAASEKISTFTANSIEYWLRFAGLNQAEDLAPVVIDVYKFRPKPLANLALINTDFNEMAIEGMVLYDNLQPDNTTDGRFFRIQTTQQV